MSLDDFADKYRLDKIDVLKIDTEGYEPLVFRGAQRLISEHRIRLFIFEHLKGKKSPIPLIRLRIGRLICLRERMAEYFIGS